MSDTAGAVVFEGTQATTAEPDSVLLPGHDVPLGRYTVVRRLLPLRQRRMVGAWCFVDHFGPVDITGQPGMQVPPHPHTGLQTVTWLAEGEILHTDSLGNSQPIRPGQLNLMSSGAGISHSEQSPPERPPHMHGLQLWVALPEHARHDEPRFDHYTDLPQLHVGDAIVTVVVGEMGAAASPALVHTPLLGAEIRLEGAGQVSLSLRPDFEHAVLVMDGDTDVEGTQLGAGSLLYLGAGLDEITIEAAAPSRLFLLGGQPFDEPLVMWWNFVGRTHEDIAQARADWMSETRHSRFGTVQGCVDDPLPAPEMPTNVRLKARDRFGQTVG
ncbi:MAG TPA: pirin family protein [Actinomycetales bacterium]|nr:pirin family protein [Actinomycetales bacterium]